MTNDLPWFVGCFFGCFGQFHLDTEYGSYYVRVGNVRSDVIVALIVMMGSLSTPSM